MDRTTKRKRVSEREREREQIQHYHILNYPQCHLVGGVED